MTRLEAHKKTLEEENRHGPLLRIEELDADELAILNASFLNLCRKRKVADIQETYIAYIDTLHQWGVMCPHPQPMRLYDGFRPSEFHIEFSTSRWYDCKLCSARVINR